ncbi:hypothetical protein B9479_007441, partial [Cryptococcus floricola]
SRHGPAGSSSTSAPNANPTHPPAGASASAMYTTQYGNPVGSVREGWNLPMEPAAITHLEAELAARVADGSLLVAVDPNPVVLSPIGAVPKDGSGWRTIHHLSFPTSFAAPLQLAVAQLVLAVRRHVSPQAGTPADDPAWKNASVKPESLSAVSPSDLHQISKLVLDMCALAKQREVAASSAGRLQRAVRGRNDAEAQLATKNTQLEATHSMLERAVVKMAQDGTTPEDIAVYIAMPGNSPAPSSAAPPPSRGRDYAREIFDSIERCAWCGRGPHRVNEPCRFEVHFKKFGKLIDSHYYRPIVGGWYRLFLGDDCDSVLSDAGKQPEYGLTTSFSSLNLTSEEPTIPISSFAAPLQLAVSQLVLAVRRHDLHQAGTPADDPACKNASVKPESLSAVSPSDLDHISKLVLGIMDYRGGRSSYQPCMALAHIPVRLGFLEGAGLASAELIVQE